MGLEVLVGSECQDTGGVGSLRSGWVVTVMGFDKVETRFVKVLGVGD